MATSYQIKTMEYLDVSRADMIPLEEQGLEAVRAKGGDTYNFDWFGATYAGLDVGEAPTEEYDRYYGDPKDLRALKYDLEYNLRPRSAAPTADAKSPAAALRAAGVWGSAQAAQSPSPAYAVGAAPQQAAQSPSPAYAPNYTLPPGYGMSGPPTAAATTIPDPGNPYFGPLIP